MRRCGFSHDAAQAWRQVMGNWEPTAHCLPPTGQDITMRESQSAFVITLVPTPGTDPIRSLRRGLKLLLRVCGLRAISIRERPNRKAGGALIRVPEGNRPTNIVEEFHC